jgi:hypothetical protein
LKVDGSGQVVPAPELLLLEDDPLLDEELLDEDVPLELDPLLEVVLWLEPELLLPPEEDDEEEVVLLLEPETPEPVEETETSAGW